MTATRDEAVRVTGGDGLLEAGRTVRHHCEAEQAMTPLDLAGLAKLHAAASDYTNLETHGRPYLQYEKPSAESKAFYEAAHIAIPQLLALVEEQAREIGRLRGEMRTTLLADEERRKLTGDALLAEAELLETERVHNNAIAAIATLRAALTEALEIAERQAGLVAQHTNHFHITDSARITALKELTK